MVLEIATLCMFILVLGLKYGAVTRILRLNQKLREAEQRCRKQKDSLRAFRAELSVAKREEETLSRRRAGLVGELHRLQGALEGLKQENGEMVQELLRKNTRLEPGLQNQGEMPGEE